MESWRTRTRMWLLVAAAGAAAAGTLRYDQTQTGDTNIHLQVKNVEVLALLGDTSFEYEYDDSDLTEKPPKPGANSTWATYDPVVEEASPGNATDEEPVLGSTTSPAPASASAAPDSSTPPPPPPPPASSAAPSKRARRCGSGFRRDANGHCRRVRRPNLQMLMNLGRKPPQTVAAPPAP